MIAAPASSQAWDHLRQVKGTVELSAASPVYLISESLMELTLR